MVCGRSRSSGGSGASSLGRLLAGRSLVFAKLKQVASYSPCRRPRPTTDYHKVTCCFGRKSSKTVAMGKFGKKLPHAYSDRVACPAQWPAEIQAKACKGDQPRTQSDAQARCTAHMGRARMWSASSYKQAGLRLTADAPMQLYASSHMFRPRHVKTATCVCIDLSRAMAGGSGRRGHRAGAGPSQVSGCSGCNQWPPNARQKQHSPPAPRPNGRRGCADGVRPRSRTKVRAC